MNARDYKMLRPDHYYHAFNRGNNKEAIFLDDQDFLNFYKRVNLTLGINQISKGHLVGQGVPFVQSTLRIRPFDPGAFTIICHCLMPNHFHFLIRQNTDVGIDEFIQKVCTSYAAYFNKKYDHIGHVFQGAFKAKLVENDNYLKYLSAYIHNNPANPLVYEYSSFKDYCGLRQGKLCDQSLLLVMFGNDREKYKQFVLDYSEKDRQAIKDLLFED